MRLILNIILIYILTLRVVTAQEWYLTDKVLKQCISDGGSIYDIEISTLVSGWGEIRYRYTGQDIFYHTVTSVSDGIKIMGTATFEEGRSGETKGASWIFTYYMKENTFKDNDKSIGVCN